MYAGDERMNECNGWVDCVDRYMDGWMHGWMGAWMDVWERCMHESVDG